MADDALARTGGLTELFGAHRDGEVTDEQRAFFEAFGYLVLPGLFASDIGAVAAAFDDLFDDPAVPRLDVRIVGHRFEPWQAMGGFVEQHPRLATLPADERLLRAVTGVLGSDVTYAGSDGHVYECVTEWHYDTPMEALDRRHVKAALYLEPLERDHGALRVVPGTHNSPGVYQGALRPFLGYDGAIAERTGLCGEDVPSWAVPSRPGDLLLWDFRVMHAAYGTTDRRRQISLNYRGGPIADRVVSGYDIDLGG